MRNTKKVWGLLMAAAMAVSLTACGGGTGSAGGTEGTKSAGQEAETDSGQVSADAAVVDGVEELTLTLSHHCSEDDSNHVYAEAFARLTRCPLYPRERLISPFPILRCSPIMIRPGLCLICRIWLIPENRQSRW